MQLSLIQRVSCILFIIASLLIVSTLNKSLRERKVREGHRKGVTAMLKKIKQSARDLMILLKEKNYLFHRKIQKHYQKYIEYAQSVASKCEGILKQLASESKEHNHLRMNCRIRANEIHKAIELIRVHLDVKLISGKETRQEILQALEHLRIKIRDFHGIFEETEKQYGKNLQDNPVLYEVMNSLRRNFSTVVLAQYVKFSSVADLDVGTDKKEIIDKLSDTVSSMIKVLNDITNLVQSEQQFGNEVTTPATNSKNTDAYDKIENILHTGKFSLPMHGDMLTDIGSTLKSNHRPIRQTNINATSDNIDTSVHNLRAILRAFKTEHAKVKKMFGNNYYNNEKLYKFMSQLKLKYTKLILEAYRKYSSLDKANLTMEMKVDVDNLFDQVVAMIDGVRYVESIALSMRAPKQGKENTLEQDVKSSFNNLKKIIHYFKNTYANTTAIFNSNSFDDMDLFRRLTDLKHNFTKLLMNDYLKYLPMKDSDVTDEILEEIDHLIVKIAHFINRLKDIRKEAQSRVHTYADISEQDLISLMNNVQESIERCFKIQSTVWRLLKSVKIDSKFKAYMQQQFDMLKDKFQADVVMKLNQVEDQDFSYETWQTLELLNWKALNYEQLFESEGEKLERETHKVSLTTNPEHKKLVTQLDEIIQEFYREFEQITFSIQKLSKEDRVIYTKKLRSVSQNFSNNIVQPYNRYRKIDNPESIEKLSIMVEYGKRMVTEIASAQLHIQTYAQGQ